MPRVFTYYDNSLPLKGLIGHSPCIIEIEADTIKDADAVFQEVTGTSPMKQVSTGCTLSPDFTFTPPDDDKLNWIEDGGYTHFGLP